MLKKKQKQQVKNDISHEKLMMNRALEITTILFYYSAKQTKEKSIINHFLTTAGKMIQNNSRTNRGNMSNEAKKCQSQNSDAKEKGQRSSE